MSNYNNKYLLAIGLRVILLVILVNRTLTNTQSVTGSGGNDLRRKLKLIGDIITVEKLDYNVTIEYRTRRKIRTITSILQEKAAARKLNRVTVVCDNTRICDLLVKWLQLSAHSVTVCVFDADNFPHRRSTSFSPLNIMYFSSGNNLHTFVDGGIAGIDLMRENRCNCQSHPWPIVDSYYMMVVRTSNKHDVQLAMKAQKSLRTKLNLYRTILVYEDDKVDDEFYMFDGRVRRERLYRVDELKTEVQFWGKVTDFYGQPFRVTLYPREPEMIKMSNGKYGGVSYEMLQILSKKLNFTPVIVNNLETDPDEKIGPFEIFVTGLEDVSSGHSDISMNMYFVRGAICLIQNETRHHRFSFKYLAPINYDYVCVAVPKAGHIPKYRIPFTCFPYDVWLAILATFFAVYATNKLLVFVRLLDHDNYNSYNAKSPTPPPPPPPPLLPSHSFLLTTLSAALNIPIPQTVNKYIKCRIVFVTYLCSMYVIVSIFQACLVTQLSAPKYYKDIDTLQELDASRLTVKTWSPLLKEIMNIPIIKQYTFTNKVKYSDFEGLFKSTNHRSGNFSKRSTNSKLKFAFIERIPLGKRKDYENFIINAGDRTYEAHTVSECPFGFYVSYVVNPRFPFVSEFNRLLHRILEVSLIQRWTQSVKYAISAEYYEPTVAKTKFVSEKKIFTLQDLEIAIVMLIAGYSISCTTFAVEITYHRLRERRSNGTSASTSRTNSTLQSSASASTWRLPLINIYDDVVRKNTSISKIGYKKRSSNYSFRRNNNRIGVYN